MKKYLSFFGLAAAGSLYKLLTVSLLTAAAQVLLFYVTVKSRLQPYLSGISDNVPCLEDLTDVSRVGWVSAVGFILVTLLLISHGCEANTRSIYTYQRLSLTEKDLFYCQGAYNTVAYVIFWAMQTAAAIAFCHLYSTLAPAEFTGNQTVFLAFYRNDYLHSLLPMSEASLWVRNGILALGLGFSAAEYPFKQRRGRFGITIAGLLLYTLIFFCAEFGIFMNTFITVTAALCCIGESVYCVHNNWNVEVSENENK